MSVTGQRIAGARQREAIRNFYFFILVLTDARADYVLARKDAIAFGNLEGILKVTDAKALTARCNPSLL